MGPLLKVECATCAGRYYVIAEDFNLVLLENIQIGEAFPNVCPLCEYGSYAILVEE